MHRLATATLSGDLVSEFSGFVSLAEFVSVSVSLAEFVVSLAVSRSVHPQYKYIHSSRCPHTSRQGIQDMMCHILTTKPSSPAPRWHTSSRIPGQLPPYTQNLDKYHGIFHWN